MSFSTATTPSSPYAFRQFVYLHPFLAFFVLTYSLTWLLWLPLVLSRTGLGVLPFSVPATPFILLAPFVGPTLSAFFLTSLLYGKKGVVALLKRYVQWRASIQWYLIAIFGVPLLLLLFTAFMPGALSHLFLPPLWASPLVLLSYLLGLLYVLIIGGPLGEEPGWRGFALPRLQQTHGPLSGSLLLGLLWGAWHLPLFLVPEWASQNGGATFLTIGAFFITIIAGSVIITWLFNNTGGSLLFVMLFHAANNTSYLLDRLFPNVAIIVPTLLAYCVAAVILVIVTKGKLSYKETNSPLI